MKRTFDLVVAGAGPSGLATGRALAEAGYSVLIVEAGRISRPAKTWLTFGEVPEPHGLLGAVVHWCSKGHLRFYTGDRLTIERPRLVCIFDAQRLLETLAERYRTAGGELWEKTSVLGFERDGGGSARIEVATSAGTIGCNLLIDATAGGLSGEREKRKWAACYATYARIYEGCTPRLPLDEVVLLDRGYPWPAAGQWSSPVSEDRYLLGEFDFWPRVELGAIDPEGRRAELAKRLDFYTWQVQDLVDVPSGAPYEEYFGVVPLLASSRPPKDNVLAIGDSAGQARPFFGVSLDSIFDQTSSLRELVDRAFAEGDFSARALASDRAPAKASTRMNFYLGMAIWHVLYSGPDRLGSALCSVLGSLDEGLKYDLLRTRLSRGQLRQVMRALLEGGFFLRLVRWMRPLALLRLAGCSLKGLYWWLRA